MGITFLYFFHLLIIYLWYIFKSNITAIIIIIATSIIIITLTIHCHQIRRKRNGTTPYHPDLAPCDFDLFAEVKKELKSLKFEFICRTIN